MSESQDSPNPFEAPISSSASSEVRELPPGDRGPMPASVITALIATGLMVLVSALAVAGDLVSDESPISSIVTFAIGVLVLYGLSQGHRLAFQWGRILGLLAAIIYTLVLIVGIIGSLAIVNKKLPMGPNAPPELANVNWGLLFFIGFAILAVMVALLWTIFFALGRQSARRYFLLICPKCGSGKVRASDFFYNSAKCKRCGRMW